VAAGGSDGRTGRRLDGPGRGDVRDHGATGRTDPGDAELVRRAQAGDQAALEALLTRHQPAWYALCRRMTGNEADALDATQDAMIAVVRGLDRYDGRAAFTTWAYRVVTNACLDQLRRTRRRPAVALDEWSEPGATEAAQPPAIDRSVVDRLVVQDGLAQLSPPFRAAVVLRDVLGLDYDEIARVLELPPGTVRSRIARGRRALADLLSPTTDDGNPATPGGVERSSP
jgi:RNA polymerase sigma-70 factor (ECF subfamily)